MDAKDRKIKKYLVQQKFKHKYAEDNNLPNQS